MVGGGAGAVDNVGQLGRPLQVHDGGERAQRRCLDVLGGGGWLGLAGF